MSEVRIVSLGGGTGQARLLKGLKTLESVVITAICGVSDSGGSTAKLAEAYHVSNATGDWTKCALALSPIPQVAELLEWRFGSPVIEEPKVNLRGHSVKNLLFASLQRQLGLTGAVEAMSEFLQIGPHRVLPVALENADLGATLNGGSVRIVGETLIDTLATNPLWEANRHALEAVFLEPTISAQPGVLEAIARAEAVVLSPGDLFTSLLPILLVEGVSEAIRQSRARVILIPNLMTKAGETDKFTVTDVLEWVERYLGRAVDHVVCNSTPVPTEILERYKRELKSEMIPNGASVGRNLVYADLLDYEECMVRHHPQKLAAAIASLIG